MVIVQPLPKLVRDELAAAVAAQVRWIAIGLYQAFQYVLHVLGTVLKRRYDRQGIGRGFVLDRKTADHASGRIPIVHEVIAPDVVADERRGVEPGTGDDLALRNP